MWVSLYEDGSVWAYGSVCVVVCANPCPQQAASCCGHKAGDQSSGRQLWALNSPFSYAPCTMGLFLHKRGTQETVMDL